MNRSTGSVDPTPQDLDKKTKKNPPDSRLKADNPAGFMRFSWDIVGLGGVILAMLTLVGLLGLTKGVFISPWTSLVKRSFGQGGVLFAVLLGMSGCLILWKRSEETPRIEWGRILALEGVGFVLVALLSIAGGHLIERAEAGLDGGVIGWALVSVVQTILPPPLSTGLFFLLLAIFFLAGSGVLSWLDRMMVRWSQEPEEIVVLKEELIPADQLEADQADAVRKRIQPIRDEGVETIVSLVRDEKLPPLDLLVKERAMAHDTAAIQYTANLIIKTLAEFGIPAEYTGYRAGPTVTQFAIKPGFVEKTGPEGETIRQKVRVSQISNLAKDLTLALSAERLRIEAPVPGQDYVGIEVPNKEISIVRLRPLLESSAFVKLNSPLGLALGKNVSGRPVVADLEKMPHLLISGTTGSGKSVCIAAITICLAMNNSPKDLRLAMLDPKMVELVRFNGLPHIFNKVETETLRMLGVLQWGLAEMDRRYKLFETARTRDLKGYNQKMFRRNKETLPRIVILIDELADLMMSAPDQTEHSIVRLAQLARATGIHLIVATQRPSTDVVTGLIKANFPARIAFNVASSVDSRVILDTNGAESLLGNGDMLFLPPEAANPIRAQGAMVMDQEIEEVVDFWQENNLLEDDTAPWEELLRQEVDESDQLLEQAVELVRRTQRASASMLQRRLRVGYPRAARLIDELEELGVVGPSQGGGREREVLIEPEGELEKDEWEDELDVEDGGDD